MNKLITSLICGTAISMTLLGAGYTANAAGTTGMDGTTLGTGTMINDASRMHPDGSMMNGTTGTNRSNYNIMDDKIRTGDNNRVAPLANTNRNGNYRTTATTGNGTNNNNNGSNWGWLGLIGLLGLAGMRNRAGERR